MTKYRLLRVEGAFGDRNAYISKGVFGSKAAALKHKPKRDSDYRIVKSGKVTKAFKSEGQQFYVVSR